MKDVRAVVLLGVKKGEEMPLGPEEREMADGWWGENFSTPSNPLAILLVSFRNGLPPTCASDSGGCPRRPGNTLSDN
jgi:hypothetical protein